MTTKMKKGNNHRTADNRTFMLNYYRLCFLYTIVFLCEENDDEMAKQCATYLTMLIAKYFDLASDEIIFIDLK